MILDRSTYEAWLLDRLEGRLTPGQEQQLDAFLAAHPDLAVALGDLPSVGGGEATFSAKDRLKKAYPPAGEPDVARLDDFLVARLEGDLSPGQARQLDRFLYEHPEHAQDAKRMAASRVPRDPAAFPAKATVERHFPPQGLPDRHRLTDFLIAAEEGDLSAEQRAALARYIAAHPEARREQRSVQAARIGREAIVFAGKERLKKREARVIALWPRLAAAASVALLVGLAWWMLREGRGTGTPIARNEQPVAPVTTPAHDERTAPAGPQEAHGPRTTPAERPMEKGALPSGRSPQAPSPSKISLPVRPASTPAGTPAEPRVKELAPLMPDLEPAPALAHTPVPAPEAAPIAAVQHPETQAPASVGHAGQGRTLGALMANAVRDEVLEEPQRDQGLDRTDAVAAVDKGLGALTGGKGGLNVQRTGARERVHLRLGRNLAISASRGR